MKAIIRHLWVFLICLAPFNLLFALGEDNLPPGDNAAALPNEVRVQVARLNSARRNDRSAAERRLIELGPAVLPHLPAPDLLPSNSVRDAVNRIRAELERRQARESVAESRVTLSAKLPVEEALHELSRQSRNPIEIKGVPPLILERAIETDFADRPFWEVCDDLSQRFSLQFDYDAVQRRLRFVKAGEGRRPNESALAYAGAFRIEVPPVERVPRGFRGPLTLNANGKPLGLLRIVPRIRPEPRLRALFLQVATRDLTVRTATGRELLPFSAEASYEFSFSGGANPAPLQFDYVVDDDFDGKPLSFAGEMTCTLAAGNESFRFPLDKTGNPRGGVITRRRGSVTVDLIKVDRRDRELRVQISLMYDTGGPAFESHRSWYLHNEVYLDLPGGRRLNLNGGTETMDQRDRGLLVEYRFLDIPETDGDIAFVYVAPTMIIDVPINFEIKSVPVLAEPAATGRKP
jgi:hypothetical protein